MSDETATEDGSGKKGGRQPRDVGPPVVKDSALTEFLESLFYNDPEPEQFPEYITLSIVAGRYGEQLKSQLWIKQFAPVFASDEAIKKGAGSRKPDKGQIVGIANMLLQKMQENCDALGHSQKYGVHAYSSKRGDLAYAHHLKSITPKGIHAKKDGDDEDDEDEGLNSRDKFLRQLSAQQNEMHVALGGLITGLLDRYNRDKDRDSNEIDKLHRTLSQKNEQLERALSLELDREERREWTRLRRQVTDKGVQALEMYGPTLMASLFGKPKVLEGSVDDTPEVLQKFIDAATDAQKQSTFGDWNDDGCVKPGILTPDQSLILVHVAQGKLSVDQLDKLIPPRGENAITQEQLISLTQVFTMEQLAPLQKTFQKRNSQQPSK